MTDIIDVGFKADTTQLKEGVASLNAFGKEANKASSKSGALNTVMKQVAQAFSMASVAISKSNLAMVRSTQTASQADLQYAESALKASNAALKMANSIKAQQQAAQSYNKELNKLAQAQEQQQKMLGVNTRGAAQSNRFNSANMLAQFQDIAVTSAMNMNPMLIAMQQGTQLQYILAQSKAPLKDFVEGLKSAFNRVGLLTIGLTGLVAVLIQSINWSKVGKTSLNALASVFDYIADNAEIFTAAITAAGAVLIAFNAKAIGTTIVNLIKLGASAVATGVKMAAAWVVGMGPVGWVLAGITAVTVAFLTFGDKIKELFTGKFGQYVKIAVNAMIGSFVAAIDTIVQSVIWAWQKIKSLWGGEGPEMGFMDTINQTVNKDLSRDYLKMGGEGLLALDNATGNIASKTMIKTIEGVKSGASAVADKFREWSDKLGKSEKDAKKIQKEIEKINKSYEGIFTKRADDLEKLKFEDSIEGLSTYDKTYKSVIYEMTKEVDNLRKTAIEAGIPLSKINEMFASAPGKIEAMALAEAEYKAQQEQLREETELYNAVVDYGSSITKSFFADMKKGLKEGESVWESFTNSLLNMLDKIQDKMMDLAIDAAFNSMKSGNTGSNSWLGSAIKAGMAIFTGGTGASGATDANGLPVDITFANGGVFSNGIYSSPTLFKFARGGKFGVMGEAGPEAVMPLRRGPDGSLGVRADGGGSPVVVNVINNSNAQARTERRQTAQGTEIDVLIDEMVGEKIGRPGTSSNNALRAYNNRQLVMR